MYSMALSIRGGYETTAAMGYLYGRLKSASNGHITRETVDDDICAMILGRRDGMIPEAPEARQILKLLEHADKAVRTDILAGQTEHPTMLSDCYKFLCEFSHPNFHSNTVAFHCDKEQNQFRMRQDYKMLKREAGIIEYLLLSTPLFIDLYDRIPTVLASINAAQRAL